MHLGLAAGAFLFNSNNRQLIAVRYGKWGVISILCGKNYQNGNLELFERL